MAKRRRAMDEWESVPTGRSEVQKPLVTVRNRAFAFNTYFVKVAELEDLSRVSVRVKPKSMQIGFRFHDNPNDRDSYVLTKDGGPSQRIGKGRIVQTSVVFQAYPWLKAVSKLDQRTRQFEPKWIGTDSIWAISICPPFETQVSDISEIPREVRGIYRYKQGNDIVYIGKGIVRSRAQSPEREDWNFETIEYSIIPDETEQIKWEAFWLDRFVASHGRLPFYNRVAGQRTKLLSE
jgi:hypothetical protein